jgi:hypothetical protein
VALGGGVRVGYRYLGMLVEPQTHEGDNQLFTLVPGYHFHALAVGPEVFVSVVLLRRRLELEVRADVLPFSSYRETPDNPGASSLAFGWNVGATLRMDLLYGLFVVAEAQSEGIYATFSGTGDRRSALVDNTTGVREYVDGGTVWNTDEQGSVGLGFFW